MAKQQQDMRQLQDEIFSRLSVNTLDIAEDLNFDIRIDEIKNIENQFSAKKLLPKSQSLVTPTDKDRRKSVLESVKESDESTKKASEPPSEKTKTNMM